MRKTIAIILAGGKGKRMGANISKQFIEINGKPIIYYTIKSFELCEGIDEIVLVLPKDEISYFKNNIMNKFDFNISSIIEGGKERQDSVYNALKSIQDCEVVLIHDGARPFVSKKIIEDGIKKAKEYGAAAPGVVPKDTIKIRDNNGFSIKTLKRDELVAIQTPQCFDFNIIKKCHEEIKKKNIQVTDDTMVVEMFGNKVLIYDGDYKNIKITTKEDLIICNEFLNN
ncbi:2-C-methyl-D-erythritol 4-phosphate cytidylyltransferase [Sarcina ventriculi]|uniref:2-C-methyl-D-erythritol 4-phosphate cytidylyltransferase n=1 Tax=Sarcina ventriculi TaxID=1267 RepID=UPI00073EC423|nr:2-C-methyl-D-erythritol 4-phosphate cytidylyltransferase [Sarcina ventriculi]